ncbi:unnamed protein product, partial [Mesorhabditis belari]|uniref:DNA topoisomerase (ATP-hydrolyzing) n=1 Tax=Mesorhabditis belari TaxID=2138241 RepID=A0AAF3F3K0_9BILA
MSDDEKIRHEVEDITVDFIRQLARPITKSSPCLKLGVNPKCGQLRYNRATLRKLARDLTALSKVYNLTITKNTATKRDVYYDDKKLYKEQRNSDNALRSVCSLLDSNRHELSVISCSRGILQGALAFLDLNTGKLIDCQAGPVPLNEDLLSLRPLPTAHFILVVEKDATFQRMIDAGFFLHYPKGILMTGRGYPDLVSRRVLSWLVKDTSLPIYGLFDADPHGIEIYLTYKYGSVQDRAETNNIFVREIQWIGLKPSHMQSVPFPSSQLLTLTHRDYMKMRRVRTRAKFLNEEDVVDEIDFITKQETKFELEALTGGGCDGDYIIRCYLSSLIKKLLPNHYDPLVRSRQSELASELEE